MTSREVTRDEIILASIYSNFCLGFSISLLTQARNRAAAVLYLGKMSEHDRVIVYRVLSLSRRYVDCWMINISLTLTLQTAQDIMRILTRVFFLVIFSQEILSQQQVTVTKCCPDGEIFNSGENRCVQGRGKQYIILIGHRSLKLLSRRIHIWKKNICLKQDNFRPTIRSFSESSRKSWFDRSNSQDWKYRTSKLCCGSLLRDSSSQYRHLVDSGRKTYCFKIWKCIWGKSQSFLCRLVSSI